MPGTRSNPGRNPKPPGSVLLGLTLFFGACAHELRAPVQPLVISNGETVDTLLVDVVEDNRRMGRRRLTIEYDRSGGRGYVTFTDLGREKHREHVLPPDGLQRLVEIIDQQKLMTAASDSRGACADGKVWDVVVRINRRVHDFSWNSCSSESSRVLRDVFRASGIE